MGDAATGSVVVYTAIANRYDVLKAVPNESHAGTDFVAFLDEPQQVTSWSIRSLYAGFADPCRNAKVHKILPHRFFPEVKYSLWIDGSVEIKRGFSLRRLVQEYLAEHDLAVFQHPSRQCIYEEAEACLRLQKDDPEVIRRQMKKYKDEGYPANSGLAECTVLLRRHCANVDRFNEAWHEEIRNHSRRDQLSFNLVAGKLKLRFRYFPGSLRGKHSNPWFRIWRHQTPADSSRIIGA
jgi:hypothetical protein